MTDRTIRLIPDGSSSTPIEVALNSIRAAMSIVRSLRPGDRIRVEGTWQRNGSLLAERMTNVHTQVELLQPSRIGRFFRMLFGVFFCFVLLAADIFSVAWLANAGDQELPIAALICLFFVVLTILFVRSILKGSKPIRRLN